MGGRLVWSVKMTARKRHADRKFQFISGIQALGFGFLTVILSCKGSDKSNSSAAADGKHSSNTPVAPFGQDVIKRFSNSWGIVRINDGTLRQGIVIQSGTSSNGNRDYMILADVPDDQKQVDFAIGTAKTEFYSGVRRGKLPNGLSLFSFSSESKLNVFKRHTSSPGVAIHALRLSAGAALAAGEVASLRGQVEQAVQESNDLSRSEAQKMHEGQRTAGGMPQARSPRIAELFNQAARLRAQMKFAFQSISVTETAAGTAVEKLSGSPADLENTVLLGQDLNVFAIRHRDQWVDIDHALDSIPNRPKGVQLAVSGSDSSLLLTCTLQWEIPPASAAFSLVAATTHELESQGSGSLEERLSKVPPENFQHVGATMKITKNLSWGGTPTTLWIKVMDDANPGKPVTDEAISLEYDGGLVAKWAKPPSELIELPESGNDTPGDLVKAREVIRPGGTVLDMIPTSDASVLLVQTDKKPFWATLDLKTGALGKVPWSPTADTLVATQGGKTYLANRKTKEVEIWDNSSSKRESVRLLDIPGDLVSLSAPRLAPGPVLVVSNQTAGFVDSSTFKAINCGADLSSVFQQEKTGGERLPRLDPATLRARASEDGSVYTLSGVALERGEGRLQSIVLRVSGGLVTEKSAETSLAGIPTVGRNLIRGIPDQGGGDLSPSVEKRSQKFPAPPGLIDLRTEKGRRSVGILGSAPFVPAVRGVGAGTAPAYDRRLYLNSTLGVLLIPEGDKIHLLRLKLPEISPLGPDFAFSGETLKIPLPRGTGHRATSSAGGDISISGDTLSWHVPDHVRRSQETLQMDWTGELGSPMTRKLDVSLIQAPARPVIISPDGKRTVELTRRTLISSSGDVAGVAGAGNVLLLYSNKSRSAWSLLDGHKLCQVESDSRLFFGDADRLYFLGQEDKLSSYDIRTGKLLQSKKFGSQSDGVQQTLDYVATGSASLGPLVAVISDRGKRYYARIDRDTLDLGLYDFGVEKPPEPTPLLRSNASGSVCWSFSSGILRQGNRATIKEAYGAIEGTPDASGRYLVDARYLMDLGRTPSEKREAKDLPGASTNSTLQLDHSGRYLLVVDFNQDEDSSLISVRRLADGFKEVFKIKFAQRIDSSRFQMISGTKTLVTPALYGAQHAVYDLDCEALEKELATAGGNQ